MANSPYTLGARCLAEFIGMIIVIGMGESALANELLPNTKGHAMGWGWAVFTFGMSFFAPLQIFAPLSAKLNPAMCLAQWITGNLNGVDFVCLSLSEFAGAFVGAVLMWLHFLPHFKTLPEPPPDAREDQLLRRRDAYREDQMAIASYNTRSDRKVARPTMRSVVDDLTFYFRDKAGVPSARSADDVLDSYFVAHAPHQHAQAVVKPHDRSLGRRTVQVADLQNHLKNLHVENVVRKRVCFSCENDADVVLPGAERDLATMGKMSRDLVGGRDLARAMSLDQAQQQFGPGASHFQAIDMSGQQNNGSGSHSKPNVEQQKEANLAVAVVREQQRTDALFAAALEADRNAKLSIFATRPAIYSPLWNFFSEASGTVFLLLTSLLIELSVRFLPLEQQPIFRICVQPLLLSLNIVVLIAGLGGVTGYAVNPARDAGPRLAHWVLPIPNKGHSEWLTYGWIPVLAPLVGGCIAGGLYHAIEHLICPGSGVGGPGVCP